MAKKNSASKNLVIVESPAKAKTINKYLGDDFVVHASMGHVRDLPSTGLCVDLENNFEPTYEITEGRKKLVGTLKAAAKNCNMLYLATDLDREGEAIAWHLAQTLGVPEERTNRVIFNAITKKAIQDAFAAPGKIDIDKVNAQQARRILDRIVGYQISPLLWKKVARGLSAGRVQSVAVKMVVEREREIRAFVPIEYWLIPAVFTNQLALQNQLTKQWQEFIGQKDQKDKGPTIAEQNNWLAEHSAFNAELSSIDGKTFSTDNAEQAKKIHQALQSAAFVVTDIIEKSSSSRPAPPFITSTLQQSASNRLGFAAKRTMRIAQQLYEGIDLGSMGTLGLITYMRTDSTHLSAEALTDARRYIGNNIGKNYLPEKPNFYSSGKNAQQAHEAVRPTDVDIVPEQIKDMLTDEQYKLYQMIWRRFVASQMAAAQWNTTTLEITADTKAGKCLYKAQGRTLVFDGFTKIWHTGSADQQLVAVKKGDKVAAIDIDAQQHFTKPPARYNEASLVKALEKEGIGRPSTYASIISTIQDRGYVEQKDRQFSPTDIGEVVTDKLNEFFPQIMDMAFTRYMEEQLDKIEEQHLDWVKVLHEFYDPFKLTLAKATDEMKHAKAEITPSEYTCPKCNKPMVYRFGKNGKFLSCSDYPTCKFASPCDKEGKMVVAEVTEHKCPNCGKPMVKKTSRFGAFLGCSDYPTCKTALKIDKDGNIAPPKPPAEPTGLKCYKCEKGELVIRQSKKGPFLGCNKFPRCRTIVSFKQLENLKDLQAKGQWPPKTLAEADTLLGRDKKSAAKTKTPAAEKEPAEKKNAKPKKKSEE
ncbi:MAG TPA: type I DNA topoisomerase [Phycisphaerales bacterium]|nr:MAG: DNA topoisomerase I [Planctomycetes bacterium GWC2_45_44]HBG78167.1 type I DNA topoisomerase [Phycisphaerales bacterium]HBR19037.1 type I DNA topoisomerase [Phycisphaerales bacterium]